MGQYSFLQEIKDFVAFVRKKDKKQAKKGSSKTPLTKKNSKLNNKA
jgi:hypothetical protein